MFEICDYKLIVQRDDNWAEKSKHGDNITVVQQGAQRSPSAVLEGVEPASVLSDNCTRNIQTLPLESKSVLL